ncbi:MAG: hypothetical protein LBT75_02190 [Bacilli bacterium]|jgi:hypothetical protein|nr:hypothetical protein [Bacilli bacterium]
MNKLRRILIFGLLLVLSTSCTSVLDQVNTVNSLTTNNGSLYLKSNDIQAFCSKKSIDNYLSNSNRAGIKAEFAVNDYYNLTYDKDHNAYQEVATKEDCQYQVYTQVYTIESNEVILSNVQGLKNKQLDNSKIFNNKVITDFINTKDNRTKVVSMKNLLKDINLDDYQKINLKAKRDGSNKIVIYPVFKFYFLKDKNKIMDYQFAGISGFRIAVK